VGRVHRIATGTDHVAVDNAVGSCVLVRHSDGAVVTTEHVWEAATEDGSTAWVALAGQVPPFEVKFLRSSPISTLVLLVPTSRSELQLPRAMARCGVGGSACMA
jgi:hypothetical protein